MALGLPLPARRRIALTLPSRTIEDVSSPPTLVAVIPHLPPSWQPALVSLRQRAEAIDVSFRVFGSAAWQMLTGLPYVTDKSDIDLLWHPASRSQLAAGVALLEAWQPVAGMRADGEIVFGDDDAVAWREWSRHDRHACVLAKTLRGPVMRKPAELLKLLDHASVEVET